MKKQEIIKFLDKEIGFFREIEDGDLYITEMRFKDIEDLVKEIIKLRDKEKEREEKLRQIIENNDRFTIVKDITQYISDKIIYTDFPIKAPFVLVDSHIIISNNVINETRTLQN